MIRALIVSSVLLTATPALAQEAAAPTASAQQQPAQQQQPASSAESVASIVDSEFPAYDGNSDGQLDKAEFTRWMVALKDQEMEATGKTLTPAEVTTWANGAFTTADADKSISVSKPELISYLSAGAS